jgi:hypothetical protein
MKNFKNIPIKFDSNTSFDLFYKVILNELEINVTYVLMIELVYNNPKNVSMKTISLKKKGIVFKMSVNKEKMLINILYRLLLSKYDFYNITYFSRK